MRFLQIDHTVFDLDKITQSNHSPCPADCSHADRELVISFVDSTYLVLTGDRADTVWSALTSTALNLTPQLEAA